MEQCNALALFAERLSIEFMRWGFIDTP
jgi:hypothetical protein